MKFGPTHKKKNTYIVKLNNLMIDAFAFGMCDKMPLPVIILNGQPTQNDQNGWLKCTKFPNPAAVEMQATFSEMKPVMGEKVASTIIEYLDKETGRPVATLFPTVLYIHDNYENDYMAHLNHASRQDLNHQLVLRQELIKKYIMSKNR